MDLVCREALSSTRSSRKLPYIDGVLEHIPCPWPLTRAWTCIQVRNFSQCPSTLVDVPCPSIYNWDLDVFHMCELRGIGKQARGNCCLTNCDHLFTDRHGSSRHMLILREANILMNCRRLQERLVCFHSFGRCCNNSCINIVRLS